MQMGIAVQKSKPKIKPGHRHAKLMGNPANPPQNKK